MILSDKGKALIFEFEGVDQPSEWPEGDSGITIGYGDDLGYKTLAEFTKDWSTELAIGALARLGACCGKKGNAAAKIAPTLADIHINTSAARRVFEKRTVPRYLAATAAAFPGVEHLPQAAQDAIFSLVYNRGGGMHDIHPGDRREMRAIRDAVAAYAKPDANRVALLKEIAAQIRSMQRLWKGKHMDGLLKRREAEAKLVESCIGTAS